MIDSNLIIYGTKIRNARQIYGIAHKNKKRNIAGTHYFKVLSCSGSRNSTPKRPWCQKQKILDGGTYHTIFLVTPMLWQCIIAITLECFQGHTHPQNPQNLYLLPLGVVTCPFDALALSARPHMGRLGAITAGGGHGCGGCDASCICAKATEKNQ
jgi:hypothetical protein